MTQDHIDLDRARALAALLDLDPHRLHEGDVLRPMWHLVYLLPRPAQRDLGDDGHPRTSYGAGVRRMAAGGSVVLSPGLRLGQTVTARAEKVGERETVGRSGRLRFVELQTSVSDGGAVRLVDTQRVVYLDADKPNRLVPGRPSEARPSPPGREVPVDPTLLFRFSALTYNAHRIHYDQHYVREVEGYPALVVHGPLQALLMAETATEVLVGHLGEPMPSSMRFSYRFVAPLFLGQGLFVSTGEVKGGAVAVQTTDATGRVTAHGELLAGIGATSED